MLTAILALSILGGADHAQIVTRSLKVGDWTAKVRSDQFTGETSCSLVGRRISFHRDTLVFHLGRDIDTSQSFFRVDDGPVRSVREPRLENETHGFFLNSGPIANPSGGEVALPVSITQGAKKVFVRPSPRYQPRAFDLGRFDEALAAAKAAGCKDASF